MEKHINMSKDKPENNKERTEIKEYGEFGLIEHLTGIVGFGIATNVNESIESWFLSNAIPNSHRK